MTTAGIALLLVIGFMALEGRLRQGDQAKSLDAGEADQGSTRRVGQAFGASMVLMLIALALDAFRIAALPESTAVGWIGVGVTLAGLGMRVWAARVLGRFYTRTLRTQGDQKIVQEGPYQLVRHPGYLGLLVSSLGWLLAFRSGVGVLLTALIIPPVLARIRAEETLLRPHDAADSLALLGPWVKSLLLTIGEDLEKRFGAHVDGITFC